MTGVGGRGGDWADGWRDKTECWNTVAREGRSGSMTSNIRDGWMHSVTDGADAVYAYMCTSNLLR